MLIEVMVAMLIFLFGILGLVGLQAALTRAQTAAKMRVDAAFLAEEYVATLWNDKANLTTYAVDSTGVCTTSGNQACADWVSKVANQLPSGTANVSVGSAGDVAITITWTVPSEGDHNYTTATQIRAADAT